MIICSERKRVKIIFNMGMHPEGTGRVSLLNKSLVLNWISHKPKKPNEIPVPAEDPETIPTPEPEPVVWPIKEPEIQPEREPPTIPPARPPEIPEPPKTASREQ